MFNFVIKSAICFLTLLLLMSHSLICSAQSSNYLWRNIPIGGGGYVTGIEFHPSEPNLIYARTDVGGAFRWSEGEQKWISLGDQITRDHRDDMGVLSIALDANNAERIYLLTGLYIQEWAPKGALLSSTDRGRTWSRVVLPFKVGGNEDGRGAGERLVVDPQMSSYILAGSNQEGLWQSNDHGENWSRITSLPENKINFVIFNADKNKRGEKTKDIFVAVNNKENPLYRTRDGGATWVPVKTSFSDSVFHRAVMADQFLYLAASNAIGPNGINTGALWRYDVVTGLWRNMLFPKGQGGISGISVDPRNSKRILASTTNRWYPHDEVFLSDNSGDQWRPLLAGAQFDHGNSAYVKEHVPHWLTDIKIDPFNANRVFFVTGYGVYETRDLNAEPLPKWRFQSDGLEETVILELISPPKGASLLSVMGDLGGFRHDDLKSSPLGGKFKPELGSNNSIAFAYKKPHLMTRTIEQGKTTHGAFSNDGGITWSLFQSEPEGARGGQVALSANGSTIVWAPDASDTFFSSDNGNTWLPSKSVRSGLKPIADTYKNNVFYAYDAEQGEIYVSENEARSFNKIEHRLPSLPKWKLQDGNLRAVPGRAGHFFVTTGAGLYRSKDYGKSVTLLNSVNESYLIAFGKAKQANHYPSIYLWGKVANEIGFFRSDDEGMNWLKLNDDMHQYGSARCIAGDMQTYNRFYIGTSGQGIIVGEYNGEIIR